MTNKTNYADSYRNIDFRKYPKKYVIGRGEQGVLIAQPYKSEILPHWRFKTSETAKKSAEIIYQMFQDYKRSDDFVGMDMARKFLQMGFTRSRRYANHADGNKYDSDGHIRQQDQGSEQSDKAQSAHIFYEYYLKAKDDSDYQRMKRQHQEGK